MGIKVHGNGIRLPILIPHDGESERCFYITTSLFNGRLDHRLTCIATNIGPAKVVHPLEDPLAILVVRGEKGHEVILVNIIQVNFYTFTSRQEVSHKCIDGNLLQLIKTFSHVVRLSHSSRFQAIENRHLRLSLCLRLITEEHQVGLDILDSCTSTNEGLFKSIFLNELLSFQDGTL